MGNKALRKMTICSILFLTCTSFPAQAAVNDSDGPRWLRDPFRYVETASGDQVGDNGFTEESASDFGLKGIFVSNGSYRALFNGQMVSPGQRVDNILIRTITPYSITIEDGNGRRRIELFNDK